VKKRRTKVRKSSTKNWGQKGTSIAIAATVSIPSGKCPFIAEDTSKSSILEWIACLTAEKQSAITYKQSVYKYWIRHSFDVNSQDYKDAVKIIEVAVPDKVKTVSDLNFDTSEYLLG